MGYQQEQAFRYFKDELLNHPSECEYWFLFNR
jgi:hypothetical protein